MRLINLGSQNDQPSSDTMDEGPFVFGYSMCFGLMGVLSVQTFIYFTRFPNDRLWMKTLVSVILLLESLITIFAFHGFWTGVTNHDSDLSAIVGQGTGGQWLSPDPLWSFAAISPLTGAISLLSHGFFCWRIYVVRQNLIVPTLVMCVSLLQAVMVSYGGIKYGLVPDERASSPMPFYLPIWLSGSLVCDLAITIYMTISLLQGRAMQVFRNTRSLSVKLIKLSIETGLITTTAAVIELILAVQWRVTMYHLAMFFVISKLYANCVVATLNSRLVLTSNIDKSPNAALWPDAVPSGSGSRSRSGTQSLHYDQPWDAGANASGHRDRPNMIEMHSAVEANIELSNINHPEDADGRDKSGFLEA